MKSNQSSGARPSIASKLLRTQIARARAEMKQTAQVARVAKAGFKTARKAFKQAKKTAKQARKNLKALSRALEDLSEKNAKARMKRKPAKAAAPAPTPAPTAPGATTPTGAA